MAQTQFADAVAAKMKLEDNYTGVGMARWVVTENDICYQQNDRHTLSLYLTGGERSYRSDKPDQKGGIGKLCTMPQSHAFHWTIRDSIEFAHLYFPQSMLNWFVGNTFERDVRNLHFPSLLYKCDDRLRFFFIRCFEALDSIETIKLEEAVLDVLFYLFRHYTDVSNSNQSPCGGLSPYHRKNVREYILENLCHKITISQMAEITALSDFHFAKMFKISFGMTPAEFVTQGRIQEAKRRLKSDLDIAQVSQDLAFSHQSHFTHVFRNKVGITPAQYKRLYQSS